MRVALLITLAGCGRIDFDPAPLLPDAPTMGTARPCEACTLNSDCASNSCDQTKCRFAFDVTISWFDDCVVEPGGPQPATWPVKVANLEVGRYGITPIPSAGRYGNAANFGYWYSPRCGGLDLSPLEVQDLNTPQDVYAALATMPLLVDFPGGDLRCAIGDSSCNDNNGENRFTMELACP